MVNETPLHYAAHATRLLQFLGYLVEAVRLDGIADLDDRCQTTDTERLHQAEDHPRGGPALGDVGRSRGVRHEAALGSLSKRVGIAVASAGAGALQ